MKCNELNYKLKHKYLQPSPPFKDILIRCAFLDLKTILSQTGVFVKTFFGFKELFFSPSKAGWPGLISARTMPTEKALPRSQVLHSPTWVYRKTLRSYNEETTNIPERTYLITGIFEGVISLELWRFAKEKKLISVPSSHQIFTLRR